MGLGWGCSPRPKARLQGLPSVSLCSPGNRSGALTWLRGETPFGLSVTQPRAKGSFKGWRVQATLHLVQQSPTAGDDLYTAQPMSGSAQFSDPPNWSSTDYG